MGLPSIKNKLTSLLEIAAPKFDTPDGLYDDGYSQGYPQGAEQAWSEFWDNYQDYGRRRDYRNAFVSKGWNDETFKPKYSLIGGNFEQAFAYSEIKDMTKNLSSINIIYYLDNFISNSLIEKLPIINFVNDRVTLNHTFDNATHLKSIVALVFSYDIIAPYKYIPCINSGAFIGCPNLEEVRFQGYIVGETRFDDSDVRYSYLYFAGCPKLSHSSLLSLINVLYPLPDNINSNVPINYGICEIGSENLAKLTPEEIQIATDKGWTLQ